jgi:hypothetical protein
MASQLFPVLTALFGTEVAPETISGEFPADQLALSSRENRHGTESAFRITFVSEIFSDVTEFRADSVTSQQEAFSLWQKCFFSSLFVV